MSEKKVLRTTRQGTKEAFVKELASSSTDVNDEEAQEDEFVDSPLVSDTDQNTFEADGTAEESGNESRVVDKTEELPTPLISGIRTRSQKTASSEEDSPTPVQRRKTLVTIRTENKDHDYNVMDIKRPAEEGTKLSVLRVSASKDVQALPIKHISQLKRVIPSVKLMSQNVSPARDLQKSQDHQSKVAISSDSSREQLNKYCRTCAGLKVPLVDIFGEKGVQMRLGQQMKHLEEIEQHNSLSTQMCMDCICDLKMSYKFFMQIKKAEVKLRSLHQSMTGEVISRDRQSTSSETNLVDPEKSSIGKLSFKGSHSDFNLVSQDPIVIDSDDSDTQELAVTTNESIHEEEYLDVNKTDEQISSNDQQVDSEFEEKLINLEESPSGNNDGEPREESSKQANPLKRKFLPVKQEPLMEVPKEAKIQKIDMQNPVSITNAEEDGIMYVTVKGSKPNELLLVKVKKMDKVNNTPDKVRDNGQVAKKTIDMKPVEKIVKRYDSLLKDNKAVFTNKDWLDGAREKRIEEEIEEYKKKREKVLGGMPCTSDSDQAEEQSDSPVAAQNIVKRNVKEQVVEGYCSMEQLAEEAETENCTADKTKIVIKNEVPKSDNSIGDFEEQTETLDQSSSLEADESQDLNQTATEYFANFIDSSVKLEQTTNRAPYTNKELDACVRSEMEKLVRILGEKDKNLMEFREYLKQRKIIISKLKDDDIISLYEDKNNVVTHTGLPDIIDEAPREDPLPGEPHLDCDYCLKTFSIKEVLEEHVKTHDYKMLHLCEDCGLEFLTSKGKRVHANDCTKIKVCSYCDEELESRGKKRQHEQKHCDAKYGQLCDVCGEKFKHQGTLDQHFKTQHMTWEKVLQCPKCPKKFAFKQKLSFHVKTVHTTMRAYLCEDCGADFKNPASLRHHRIRKHQPVGNKRECSVCQKLVPFYSLSKHMHTHKDYTISCPHCDKKFKNQSTLKQHLRIHEDQRQYRCDTCGVGFNRRDGLRLHLKVHEKTGSRGLKECCCQVCGKKFQNHSMLVIHRNREHKDGRQFTCRICNRSMISNRSLQWHMSHIHNEEMPITAKEIKQEEPKRVQCQHCDKDFKTEMILRTHIKNTHVEKDPMKCLDCELMFTSEVRLRHHMMVIHDRLEGTLVCPHCPKRFVNQLRLKTHMISHSEDRPYKCEVCDFMLKTKIQLIKHRQNRHSNERPLQCRYCPWRCKQVSALVCHERTHTNERPYGCSVCHQRFKYLGDKNKHERRHESLGGAGFKRIVTGRNNSKSNKSGENLEQDLENNGDLENQIYEEEQADGTVQQFIKFGDGNSMDGEHYEQVYVTEQEYEEMSQNASDAAEVIMSMEDPAVYTEEVTAEPLETSEIDEDLTTQILQNSTVVHVQDESGKIQVIPMMLALPDLQDENSEVGLATASIMYST